MALAQVWVVVSSVRKNIWRLIVCLRLVRQRHRRKLWRGWTVHGSCGCDTRGHGPRAESSVGREGPTCTWTLGSLYEVSVREPARGQLLSLRKSNILRRAFILPRLPGEPGTQLGLRAESSTGRATASSILRGCTWAVGGTFVRSGRVSRAHATEVCLGVSRIRGRRHGSRAFPLLEPVATHASHNGNGQGPLFRGRCATSPRPRRWTCRDQIQKWTRTGRADCQLMTKTLPSWDAQ